jgi:hypothetical protein
VSVDGGGGMAMAIGRGWVGGFIKRPGGRPELTSSAPRAPDSVGGGGGGGGGLVAS